jgi:hypothetical protein
MRMRLALILPVTLVLAAIPGHAKVPGIEGDNPVLSSRWNVQLGGFAVDLDTSIAATFEARLGTLVNLEQFLGLPTSEQTWRIDGFYRIKPKHTLEFEWLTIRRSASNMIQENFEFEDVQFAADATINSNIDMDNFRIMYKYSFVNNGTVNAGFEAGLSTFTLSGDISGQANVRDSSGQYTGMTSFDESSTTILAPVPAFGMFIDFAVRRWLILRLEASFLDLETGSIEGRFQDTRGTLDFYFSKHVGIGLGFNTVALEFQDSGTDPFNIDYSYGGVLLYLGISY